jgi:hypothetical protein
VYINRLNIFSDRINLDLEIECGNVKVQKTIPTNTGVQLKYLQEIKYKYGMNKLYFKILRAGKF